MEPGRAGEDGPAHGPATAPDGAAPAVEQGQPDLVASRHLRQLLLGAVQHPGRGERARLLGRVGVAQHHLLAPPARREVLPVAGVGQQPSTMRLAVGERVGGLEQGHHVEPTAGHPRRVGQVEHVEDVLGRRA